MIRSYAIAGWALIALSAHAETPADFAFRMPLATPSESAFYRVEIPPAVYEHVVRRDLGDLRVFNADGTPVAYAFLPTAAPARERGATAPLALFPLRAEANRGDLGDIALTVNRTAAATTVELRTRDGKPVAAERLVGYLVDTGELDEPLSALRASFRPGSTVTTRIRVEASDDLATWRTVATAAPLFALEFGGRRLTRDRIEIASTKAKYLRVTFEAGQPAIELELLQGEFAERLVEAPRQWREVQGVVVRDENNAFEFDVGGMFPIDRVTLLLPDVNTVAPTQLFARASSKDDWRAMTSGVFYRLRQDGVDALNAPVRIAGGDYRYWKAVVDAKAGGIGASPPKLSYGWYPGVLVFAAHGRAPFEIAFGSARVKPSALGVETLVPGYDARKPSTTAFPFASSGTLTTAPDNRALETPIDAKRWLLWSTLVLAAIVLGWMALSLSRQMRKSPSDSAGQPPPQTTDRNG